MFIVFGQLAIPVWLLMSLCEVVFVLLLLSLPLFAKLLSLTVCDWLASCVMSWHSLLIKLAELVSLVSKHVLRRYGSRLFTSLLQRAIHIILCHEKAV